MAEPAAAVRKARSIADDAQRQAILGLAAQNLMSLRRYPEASAMFKAAAKGSADAASVLGLAEVMRELRPLDEIESGDGPEDLFLRLSSATVRRDREEVLAFYTDRMSEEESDRAWEDTERGMALLDLAAEAGGFTLEVALDLGLGLMEQSLDGDDQAGYRARLHGNFGGMQQEETLLMAREDGAWKVVCQDLSTAHLAAEEILDRLDGGDLDGARQWLDWVSEMVQAPAAGDPYAGPAFFHLWKRGAAADESAMRLAAASLLANGPKAKRALRILDGLPEAVDADAARHREMARAEALAELGNHVEHLALVRAWTQAEPGSEAAFRALCDALVALERWDALTSAAQLRLETEPDDPEALRALAEAAWQRDELESAAGFGRRLAELGKAGWEDYVRLIWVAIRQDKVDAKTLADGQQAVQIVAAIEDELGETALRALAAAYAASDRPSEAREVLLQALLLDHKAPRAVDWWIVGQIATSYGVSDAAEMAFTRVKEDPEGLPFPIRGRRQRPLIASGA